MDTLSRYSSLRRCIITAVIWTLQRHIFTACQSCSHTISNDDSVPMEIHLQLRLYRLSTDNASDSLTNLHRHVKSCSRLHPRWALKTGILVGHQSLLNRLSFLPSNLRTPFKIFNSLSSISTTEQKNC